MLVAISGSSSQSATISRQRNRCSQLSPQTINCVVRLPFGPAAPNIDFHLTATLKSIAISPGCTGCQFFPSADRDMETPSLLPGDSPIIDWPRFCQFDVNPSLTLCQDFPRFPGKTHLSLKMYCKLFHKPQVTLKQVTVRET